VTIGEQTTNEMCFVFLGATTEGPARSPFSRSAASLFRPKEAEAKSPKKPNP
jgi:hypothetical protein